MGIRGGDVLLFGNKLRVERCSAATGTWTLLEPLARSPLTASALDGGKVLVTELGDGTVLDYIPTSELYDPASPPCAWPASTTFDLDAELVSRQLPRAVALVRDAIASKALNAVP